MISADNGQAANEHEISNATSETTHTTVDKGSMRFIERYVIRILNFADRPTTKRLLDAGAQVRSTVGTHLVLELIRRVRNDTCPIAWVGHAFADSELSRDELSNDAYNSAVTYCLTNTAAVVQQMNVDGLRSWLEETLLRASAGSRRLFVPGLWPLADWTLHAVMGVTPVDCCRCDHSSFVSCVSTSTMLDHWGATTFDGTRWKEEASVMTCLAGSSGAGQLRWTEVLTAPTCYIFSPLRRSVDDVRTTERVPLFLNHRNESGAVDFCCVGGDVQHEWFKASLPKTIQVVFASV
jgi:hypothetical protein